MEDGGEIKKLRNWLGTGSINIFGRPFSGKDTQAKKLAQLFGAPIIGGGDIIRASQDTAAINHIGTGKLAPQEKFLELVLPLLSDVQFMNLPLILSSLGRWHGEEQSIIKVAAESNHPITAVITLIIPEQLVVERWKIAIKSGDRGFRNDDNLDSIDTRLKEFKAKTLPVIEYYRKLGILIEIDGTQDQASVTNEILQKLSKLSTQAR